MLFPSRQHRNDDPFDGLTDKQMRVYLARVVDQDSYGRIALREGIGRKTAWRVFCRAVAAIVRNGWEVRSPLSPAA